jgi:MinD-like ATPase involved in chromosome partitioning or flagellar assembly
MADFNVFLPSLDILQQLPDEELTRIAGRLKERRVRDGQSVFRQGDSGDAMYPVFDGRVKVVSTDAGGEERVLAFTEEGGFFGEMVLLTGEARSTDVIADRDTTLLELRKTDFEERVASHPLVLRQLLKMLAERQSAQNARLLQRASDDEMMGAGGAKGKVYTVYSSRGGSGKSTVAMNLAVALAQQNPEQVVLLDLALTFGHTSMVLDLQPRTSLASMGLEALSKFDRDALNHYLMVHSSTLRVLPGSVRPQEGEGVSQEHVQTILDLLKRFYAYIVVDTSSNFADSTLAALEGADRIIMVVTPELTTIRDIMECQRIFSDVVHIPQERLLYLLNQPYGFHALSRQEFETGLNRSIDTELPHGGDGPVLAAVRGQAIVASQPNSPVARAPEELARGLAGAPARARGACDTGASTSRRPGGPLDFLRRR